MNFCPTPRVDPLRAAALHRRASNICWPRASASKWKSKVRWDLAEQIDWRKIQEDSDFSMLGLEKEISERLQQKALFNKYLGKAAEGARPVEEV